MFSYLLWIFFLSEIIQNGLFLFDSSDDSSVSNSSESVSNEGSVFDDLLIETSKEHIKCGPKSKCPTHNCRLDPAVIHGYCCGCPSSDSSDESPYLCPLDLQCPLNTDILCSQFHYTLNCCCPKSQK